MTPLSNTPELVSAKPPIIKAGTRFEAPEPRRTQANRPANAAAKVRNGHTMDANLSPSPKPKALPVRTSAAIGASTSRDQCMSVPGPTPRRYCIWSNQPCPARKSRTSTMRTMSSVPRSKTAGSNGDCCAQPSRVKTAAAANAARMAMAEPQDLSVCEFAKRHLSSFAAHLGGNLRKYR